MTRQDDAFADFSVAPYIASQKEDTFTNGDWAWMALDLRQGKGRQLVAVTCDAGCATYLSDFTARLLAASGPVQPIAPPLRVLAPTPDPDPDPVRAAVPAKDVPKPRADPADFVDERLSVTLIGPEDEVILLDSIRLADKLDHHSPEDRRAIRAALDTLLSDSAVDRAAALVQLIDFGVLDSGLQPYAIEVAERGYRLVLRAPPPPPPRLLTGVDLLLTDPPGSAIVANCVPEAEISHPDHPSLRLPLEIDLKSAVIDPGGEEVYGRFTLSTDNTAPILSMPPRELSLRLFAPSEVRPYADARPQPSSCSLSWGGHFPETALPLADLTDDPGAPDAPDLPVSVTEGGRVVFADAALTSTARPVFVLLYNATGLEDTNGMPLRPDLYPGWTHARGGRDMMSALSILASSAQTVFSRRVEDLFLLQAAGGVDKGFLPPEPLTADSALRAAKTLHPGEVGPLNLENELKARAASTATPPRFAILGRSGLDAGTDYCATPPALPDRSRRGSLVIDFLSQQATFDLSKPVQATLINPTGTETFATAAERLATRCPDDGSGLTHWVVTPDVADQLKLIHALETLAPYLFGDLQ